MKSGCIGKIEKTVRLKTNFSVASVDEEKVKKQPA